MEGAGLPCANPESTPGPRLERGRFTKPRAPGSIIGTVWPLLLLRPVGERIVSQNGDGKLNLIDLAKQALVFGQNVSTCP